MEKSIQTGKAVACKLKPALIKAINYKLKNIKKEKQKKEKIIER